MDIKRNLEGTWQCANFLGDSFEVTAFDDGGLMLEMVRKRLRARGDAIRLDPCSQGCWEAENQVRLRCCGKTLRLQHYRDGKWCPELHAFRASLDATSHYFRRFLRAGKKLKEREDDNQEFIIKRESSTVFKLEPFCAETAFKRRTTELSWTESLDLDATSSPLCTITTDPDVMDESQECKICMAHRADVVLMPCGHSGICEQCVTRIHSANGYASCPFCRQPMTKVAKIHTGASQILLTDDNVKLISDLTRKPRIAWT